MWGRPKFGRPQHVDENSIGSLAQYRDGFGCDGSNYNSRMIKGKLNSPDILFANTCKRIERGRSYFKYGGSANDLHIDYIVKLIKTLEEHNIAVITFFPPFASPVCESIAEHTDDYRYIRDLKTKLANRNIFVYDYSDPGAIESSDCEFIDGFHGGDVTFS
jgi:hypothetical protein